MTFRQLTIELSNMYNGALKGEMNTMILLFAIKYAKDLDEMEGSLKDLVKAAGLRESYATELNKGRRLSKYVEIK